MKENAFYHDQQMVEFIGNPLIETLPPMEDPEKYPRLLKVLPDYSEDERKKEPTWRLARLQRLSHIHIPTKEDSMLMLGISRCLRWSYVGRNPIPFTQVKQILEKEGKVIVTETLERYLTSPKAPMYGFPVLGISGVGKTTSVENVLSLFPQVISHTAFRGIDFNKEQLVWLKVDCPPDGTPKGLCSAILRGIDQVLESDYTEQILRNRMSKDVLLIKVSKLIQSLFLGILVIDDIQNLCGAKENVSDELLSFMVSLANNLRIPVIMVGSPKILSLLQREFQQAKRASGEGEIRMNLMERNSQEWKRFMKSIWRYQYTANRVNLTEKMDDVFFAESVGNPFVAAMLYKLVQDDAIISKKEKFDINDVTRVSKEKMGITTKMRGDMLAGVDIELNTYRHLWEAADSNSGPVPILEQKQGSRGTAASEEYNAIVTELSIRLEKAGISINEARSYARQAIAAYPDDQNQDVLFGYAMALLRAKVET